MINKTRLIKKDDADNLLKRRPETKPVTEKHERAILTGKALQNTRDWIENRRQQQTNVRQSFAALFMAPDTQSTAS
jgi:hypothetical protein